MTIDEEAYEYFIPTEKNGLYGDEFLGDFYLLEPKKLTVISSHTSMDDLKRMMKKDKTSGAVYNVGGNFNVLSSGRWLEKLFALFCKTR